MTGPEDPAAAGRDRLRAGHADREQVIEALKDAFVQGRLTRDELDVRAGRALAARTRAELAALTADIPAQPAVAGSGRLPAPVRRRPLARAAGQSGISLCLAAACMRVGFLLDPGARPGPYESWAPLAMGLAFAAILAAVLIMVFGAVTWLEQRPSRG
jgi:hypothetical protein